MEIAAAGGAKKVFSGLASKLLPGAGLAMALMDVPNHPAAPSDAEDRAAMLDKMTRRWGVRPDARGTGGVAAEAGASAPATPDVDTSKIEAAKTTAQTAGAEIQAALNVSSTPSVDTSQISAAVALANQLLAALNGVPAAAARAAGAASRALKNAGALHDGYETEGGR